MTTRAAARGLNDRLARDLDRGFPALVETHVDRLFSGIRRLAPSHADAEDLTQDTLVRAYRALSNYEPERIAELRLRPWLWTIALNLCRSAARTRSRRVTEVALDAAVGSAAAHENTEAAAVSATMEAAWQRRLEALSDPQRTAVVLRHVVDLPYGEIARVTGRPLGTVKADVHRGVARLRDILMTETDPDRER